MLFFASYWWLWVILTVVSCFASVISFLVWLDGYGGTEDKARIIFIISAPISISGLVISIVSIILAIIQFAKS